MTLKFEIEPAVYSSLGLQALCQRIRESGVCDILELGPARNKNLDFWSRFNPSIFIADLRSSLPFPLPPMEGTDSEASEIPTLDWGKILSLPMDRSYNVILAWDLFNYLEISAVSSLIRYLSRYCRPGTLLFSLIFDQKQMPEEITVYRIIDESHLAYETSSTVIRTCPRHQPRTLAGVMSNFCTADSFRLRNSIIEYIYKYEGEPGTGIKALS
jgi:hypothetical protein